jgi:hypothetical protein
MTHCRFKWCLPLVAILLPASFVHIKAVALEREGNRVVSSEQGSKTKRTMRLSQKIKMRVELGEKKPASSCKAKQSLSYYSSYEIVDVESEIEMTGCKAASGEYAVRVTHKTEEGKRNNTIFEETWEVSSQAPLVTTKTYDLGLGQYISKVKPRDMKFECTESNAMD